MRRSSHRASTALKNTSPCGELVVVNLPVASGSCSRLMIRSAPGAVVFPDTI